MAGTDMSGLQRVGTADSKAMFSEASAPVSFKEPASQGTVCRCRPCRLSIHVVSAELPVVCPFCHRKLTRENYPLPLSTPARAAAPSAMKPKATYHRPTPLAVFLLICLSIILLALAVYFKFYNLRYFWYQPWINLYSVTVGVFIMSRFLLAIFYMPPRDVGYEPTVAVVVACRNEADCIEQTIDRIYSGGYPRDKLEVVAVNDGSTDNTLAEMMRTQGRHHSLVVVNFEENKGKRHGMAAGAVLAKNDILVFVDSDSFLLPGAIRKVVQGLADPTVAAVSGHTDVENVAVNILTKMQDVRYFVSYRVMKAAESIFGAVSCCPGCFSAYRKALVLNVLDQWLHQRFLGRQATFGDDRSLTNFLLRDYRVLYDSEALATTIVPEHWGKYIRQQCRWKRSWIRELFVAGRFLWRKHPIASISWYAMTILPLIAPLVMFNALVIGPFVTGRPASFYLGGVLLVTLIWGLYYLEKTGRPHWWTAFVFTVTYIFFFSWQGYYGMVTMRETGWGTR